MSVNLVLEGAASLLHERISRELAVFQSSEVYLEYLKCPKGDLVHYQEAIKR